MSSSKRRGSARFTWFFVEAYVETEFERDKLRSLRMSYRDHACILHDRDTYDDDVIQRFAPEELSAMPRDPFGRYIKKPHWHFVFRTNQRTVKNFATELGVEERFVQGITSPDAALRYLVHADDPDKFQYPHELIEGNLVERALDALRHDVCPDDDQCVLDLLAIVYEQQPYNLAELAAMAARAGLFSHYRKNYAMVRDAYREMCYERHLYAEPSFGLEEVRREHIEHERAVKSVREKSLADRDFCERAAVVATERLFAERLRGENNIKKGIL